MTDSNVVSLKAITPPRWEGEVTDYMLEMIVKGLLVPNVETSRRLAYELMKRRSLGEARGYGKPTKEGSQVVTDCNQLKLIASCGSPQGHKGLGEDK
jgi:hypothetical protein